MLTSLLAAAVLSPVPEVPRPASALVFPTHRSSARTLTLLSVTNTNTSKNGKTMAFFHYVNAELDPQHPLKPKKCSVFCVAEVLTPADTVTVLTNCDNASSPSQGYVVVWAKSPTTGQSVSHNYLIGSELTIDVATGAMYSYLPAPFRAIPAAGASTDLDRDGKLDFDDKEYEAIPDALHLDSFLGVGRSRLALLHLSSDFNATVSVDVQIWNDNEFPMSFHFEFRCWFEIDLARLSQVFTERFLRDRTPHDPGEVDINCDRRGDFEAGWARFSGRVSTSGGQTNTRPAILGAVLGDGASIEGGRLLWGSSTSRPGEF